jgi:hypothetical protein
VSKANEGGSARRAWIFITLIFSKKYKKTKFHDKMLVDETTLMERRPSYENYYTTNFEQSGRKIYKLL